jgi:three-Cys-motif partner protein
MGESIIQGQSVYTKGKQAALSRILAQHMAICRRLFTRDYVCPEYQYYDLFAGCGENETVGCEGSPLVFLKTARRARLPYRATFIEQDEGRAVLLRQAIDSDDLGAIRICRGDNAVFLPHLLRQIQRPWTFGIIYADPNGMPPFDLLAQASRTRNCKRIDILIYASATTIKRVRGAFGRDDLATLLGKIDKKTWLIQSPRGKAQWTFLFGTNHPDYNDYRAINLYRLDSEEGRGIFERLNNTSAELERQAQPELIEYNSYAEYLRLPEFRAVRAQVMRRAGGVCERCKKRPATEPHHLRYPAWGTLDVPENMIAVCHECHCTLHGKDN